MVISYILKNKKWSTKMSILSPFQICLAGISLGKHPNQLESNDPIKHAACQGGLTTQVYLAAQNLQT